MDPFRDFFKFIVRNRNFFSIINLRNCNFSNKINLRICKILCMGDYFYDFKRKIYNKLLD